MGFINLWDRLYDINKPLVEYNMCNNVPIVINEEGLIIDGIKRVVNKSYNILNIKVIRDLQKKKLNDSFYIQNFGNNLDEIIKKSLFLDVIVQGILNIRICFMNNDFEQIYVEANHIHNITNIIKKFDIEIVEFYKKVERKQYIKESNKTYSKQFKAIWEYL